MYSFTHCGANSYPHLSLLFFIICRYRYVTWSPNVPICIQWCPPALLYNDFIIRQRYHSMAGQHRLIALPSVAITFYYKYDRVFFKFYHFSLSSSHLTCRWYDKKFTRVPYLHLYIFTWMNNPSDNPSTPYLTPNFLVSPLWITQFTFNIWRVSLFRHNETTEQ